MPATPTPACPVYVYLRTDTATARTHRFDCGPGCNARSAFPRLPTYCDRRDHDRFMLPKQRERGGPAPLPNDL